MFNLSVTDLAFRYLLDHWRDIEQLKPGAATNRLRQLLTDGRNVYLRLGLSRPFGDDKTRCYLQFTGVHTLPDYLGGRCHADLRPATELPPVDVPF